MKKIYFLTLLMAASLWLSAQTYVSEDFSAGNMPPAGWTIDGYQSQWTVEATDNAGGIAPEAMFTYTNAPNGTSRLISPMVDLTGVSTVCLSFQQYYDFYDLGCYIGVATRSGSGNWTSIWEFQPGESFGPESKLLQITGAGQSDFQFCLYIRGNLYNVNYWYIDDIKLFAPYNVDGAMSKITTSKYVSGAVPVEGVVTNFGLSTITSLDVSWMVTGGTTYTTTFNDLALGFGETYNFSCNDLFLFPIGGYNLDVWVSAVNGAADDNPDNDLQSKFMSVYSHSIDRKPSFEEFTSSTCAPCAQFNTTFNPWTESHADQITLIKYQMNWPGNGDPYYTEEGGVRRNYYGVSYVPWPQCNGAYVDYNVAAVQAAFDEAILQPGLAKIAATHSLNGTVMTVTANILPFANFTDFRAHIIVIENVTTQNIGGNGETAFHHVMMKMMPGPDGTVLNLNDREPVSITETVDLAGTNIEEFTDLSVVVLFQDYASKEIFQSEYSGQDAVFNTDPNAISLTYDGNPVPDFSSDVYEYNIELPVGTTEVPVVEGYTADSNATMVVVPAWELPGTTTIDVYGEDLMSRKTYNINFTVAVGIDDPVVKPNVSIYPNPANNRVYFQGCKNSDISFFTLTGQKVMSVKGFAGNSVDVSSIENGIYTVQIIMEDHSTVTRKITILR